MTCSCGAATERKAHHRDDTVVTVYDECTGCGVISIHSDTTGHAVRRAFRRNVSILAANHYNNVQEGDGHE